MKHYLIEIATGYNAVAGKAVYEYGSRNEAVAKFHKKLGTAMDSSLYDSVLLMVIDEDGKLIERGCYKRETAQAAE